MLTLSSKGFISVYVVLLWLVKNIPSEALVLPDGRTINILNPNNYTYHIDELEQLNETLHREYALFEIHPNIALLCPKDYFIGKITQELVVNSNMSYRIAGKINTHSASYGDRAGNFGVAPCPTLYNCLGFQACLFKFGNEFCRRDAAPELRKMLLVSTHCLKDSRWKFRWPHIRRKDYVLHIRYKSRLEEQAFQLHRDYINTVIAEERIPENAVFGAKCSSLKSAINHEGYRGECYNTPMDTDVITQHIWRLLGRAKSSKCRSELLQIFCAYQYNSAGLCVPPLFLDKDNSKRTFSFQSMPDSVTDGTMRKYINASSNELTPVRIGFILLLHSNAPVAVQLLKSIWKPYHFFVVHIDKRSTVMHQDFGSWLSKESAYSENVVILPQTRSFATSWGSYQIIRAQLEAIAELLKMGSSWDFAINLSGADLPLRDVDDLSAALAPYRGLNFLPFSHWKNNPDEANDTDNLVHEAFHSCDDYVFKVSETAGMPTPEDFELYNAPQWGVFSRDFATYLVDQERRSELINKYQFLLQTHIIPDESYIITVLMNSPFRHTFRQYAIHTSKEFSSNNADHLCRHSTDADFCGQGPAVFEHDDTTELMSLSHRSFFARKFSSDLNDPTRKFVFGLSDRGYGEFIETFLPQEIIRHLAEVALSYLVTSVDGFSGHSLILEHVINIRVLPSLTPRDPCCASPLLSGLRRMTDHQMWMDIAFRDESTGDSQICRVSLEPAINGRFCYPDGDLRMIFVSPWTKQPPGERAENDNPERIGLQETMPFPYGPAQIQSVSVSLIFARDDNEKFTCLGVNDSTLPIVINRTNREVSLLVGLFSAEGRLSCSKTETFKIAFNENSEENGSATSAGDEKYLFYVHTFSLNCGLMEAGPWTLQLIESMGSPRSRVYKIPFYLLDLEDKENLRIQFPDIQHLWKIKGHAIFPTRTKFLSNKRSLDRLITTKVKKYEFRRKKASIFVNFFACYGGLLACIVICFALHFWVSRRSVTVMYRKVLLYYLLAVSIATVLQAMLLLWWC